MTLRALSWHSALVKSRGSRAFIHYVGREIGSPDLYPSVTYTEGSHVIGQKPTSYLATCLNRQIKGRHLVGRNINSDHNACNVVPVLRNHANFLF